MDNRLDLKLDIRNTALLVVDVQRDFFMQKDADDPIDDLALMNEMLKPLQSFINKIRDLGVEIIFTKYIEKIGSIPLNIKTKNLSGMCEYGSKGAELYLSEIDEKRDVIVEKHTWDSFSNPELSRYLQEKNIENIIVTGVTLGCCVFSTVAAAFSHGYNVIVPMELVAGKKRTLHLREPILELMQRYYAFVVNQEEIINNLKR
jgi:ureidoacrylate peracid hydrolase